MKVKHLALFTHHLRFKQEEIDEKQILDIAV